MNAYTIGGIILVIVLGAGGIYLANQQNEQASDTNTAVEEEEFEVRLPAATPVENSTTIMSVEEREARDAARAAAAAATSTATSSTTTSTTTSEAEDTEETDDVE